MKTFLIELTEAERMIINFNLKEEILGKKETLKYLKKDPSTAEDIKQIKSRINQLEDIITRLYLSKPRTYKERLKSEIEDLKRKTKELLIYIDEKSNPEERGVLKTQYITMLEYLTILEKRRNKIKC